MNIQNNTNGFANNSFNIRSSANTNINANYGSISGGEQLARNENEGGVWSYGDQKDPSRLADPNYGRDTVEISNGNGNRNSAGPVIDAEMDLINQLGRQAKKGFDNAKSVQNATNLAERLKH